MNVDSDDDDGLEDISGVEEMEFDDDNNGSETTNEAAAEKADGASW